jgi:hypothetical protein
VQTLLLLLAGLLLSFLQVGQLLAAYAAGTAAGAGSQSAPGCRFGSRLFLLLPLLDADSSLRLRAVQQQTYILLASC